MSRRRGRKPLTKSLYETYRKRNARACWLWALGSDSEFMTTETAYDSRADTLAHIDRVQTLIQTAINNLSVRAVKHDRSKLEEPEKSTFDACTLKLKAMAYGSDEYKAALAELAESVNRAARARLGRSLSIRHVDAGSCNGCELELHALSNAFYDL